MRLFLPLEMFILKAHFWVWLVIEATILDKNIKNNGLTMSSFNKALKSSNNNKYSPLPHKNSIEVPLDHFWSRLLNFDQGGVW